MPDLLEIAFFASSLVSSYWNGAATYYRGLARALHARGHRLTFHEPDAYDRQAHRDIPDPPWARIAIWDPHAPSSLARAPRARYDRTTGSPPPYVKTTS